MAMSLDQLAEEFAQELILYPSYSGTDIAEFADERGVDLGDDGMGHVILKANKHLLKAYELWKDSL